MIDFTRSVTPSGALIVELRGKLDLAVCEYFFECIQDEIDSGFHRIIVDCKELGAIPSSGIGMLIRVRSRVEKRGGFVILTNVQSHISDLLHFLHLENVFRIYPNVDAALEAVGSET